jgi:hypothetical protein
MVTFPVAFTEVFNMQCTIYNADANLGKDTFCQVGTVAPTRAKVYVNWSGAGTNYADEVFWFAIGR